MWEDGAEVCFSLLSSFHQVEVGFSGTPGMQLRWWKERLARGSLFAEKRVRAWRERQCANQLACRGRLVRDKGGKRYNMCASCQGDSAAVFGRKPGSKKSSIGHLHKLQM